MSWQYRILRDYDGETPVYSIVERYDNLESAYCDASVGGWESVGDLFRTLDMMMEAFEHPMLALEKGRIIELPMPPLPGTEAPAVAP